MSSATALHDAPCGAGNPPRPGRSVSKGSAWRSGSMPHELHLHTCYSFLDGASEPRELVLRAKQLGYRSLAVTDHDGLYGAMAFALACRAEGIQPITGVELTLRYGFVATEYDRVHITLLARSEEHTSELQSRLHLVCR